MFRYIEINGFMFINFIDAAYLTIWKSLGTVLLADYSIIVACRNFLAE